MGKFANRKIKPCMSKKFRNDGRISSYVTYTRDSVPKKKQFIVYPADVMYASTKVTITHDAADDLAYTSKSKHTA